MPNDAGSGIAAGLRRLWSGIALATGTLVRRIGREAAGLDPQHRRDGLGLLLIAMAAVVAAPIWFGTSGWFATGVANIVNAANGMFDVFVPVLLVIMAVRVMRHPDEGPDNGRIFIGGTLVWWMALVFWHVLHDAPAPGDPTFSESGGLFGYVIGNPLLGAVGRVVTLIIVFIVFFFAMLILTKTPVAHIPRRVAALLAFMKSKRPERFSELSANAAGSMNSGRTLRQGIVVNFLNPNPWMFWISVGAPLTRSAWMDGPQFVAAFLVPFYLLLVGGKVLLAGAVHAGRSRISDRGYSGLLVFTGLLQFGLAASFVFRALA